MARSPASRLPEQPDAPAGCRVVDQHRQPPELRLLLLRAHHPETRQTPISRWLRLKERPRLPIRSELRFMRGVELLIPFALCVRVAPRSFPFARPRRLN